MQYEFIQADRVNQLVSDYQYLSVAHSSYTPFGFYSFGVRGTEQIDALMRSNEHASVLCGCVCVCVCVCVSLVGLHGPLYASNEDL